MNNANRASFDEKDLTLKITAKFILYPIKNEREAEEYVNSDRNSSSIEISRGSSTVEETKSEISQLINERRLLDKFPKENEDFETYSIFDVVQLSKKNWISKKNAGVHLTFNQFLNISYLRKKCASNK